MLFAVPETVDVMLREGPTNLRLLRWLAIMLPLLFLGLVELARDAFFSSRFSDPAALAFFFGVLGVAIVLFSYGIFRLIGRLQGRILTQNERLAALNSIATASAESPGLEPLLRTGLEQALAVLGAGAGLICAVDLARAEHSAVASRGFSQELVRSLKRIKLCDDPIAQQVVQTGRAVVLERLFEDPRVSEAAQREGVRSAISVPLKSHGEVAGILVVASHEERLFSPADEEFLVSVGGQLGMAIKNAAVLERSLQRNREMEALLAISAAVTSSLDLPQVLDRSLDAILEVTSAEAAEIWLAEGEGALTLKRHRGASPEIFHAATRLEIGEGLPGLAVKQGSPVVVHDLSHDGRFHRTAVTEAGFETYCALPLRLREAPMGVLGVAARAPEALAGPEELRLLAGISEVISVAIENASLHERVQDSAVVEERERIAREMHDGLAQVLTYINAQSLAIRKLQASGRFSEAEHELARLEEAVQRVYADVREAILGLRTSPRSRGGLLPALRGYLESYQEMTGIEARVRLWGESEAVRLTPSAEIQLTRIVQEALSNVRKHARASAVSVSFELESGRLRVVVRDDGRGFDPEQLSPRGWPRFGLQTMRERAEAVGGGLQVLARPGEGTSVVIDMPVEQRARAEPPREPAGAGARA